MTTWDGERWQAATAELDGLLDLEPEAREGAMAALFRRDARLATDVAQLLADLRSAHAERFLDAPAPAPLPTVTEPYASTPGAGGRSGLAAGTTFGGYRILSVLGRGGMGVVYSAEEIESGRRLALKILEHRLADERHRERFAREGRLAASIDHPHCVFVLGAGEFDGRPFIAMELMQGTLADRLASSGAMAPIEAVDVALQLIAGLDAAGRVGVLHRDVKPSNCFVDGDGVVKIGDFGISRSTRADETTLATRDLISATPMYASPEQLRGDTIDVRADVYSLGATLYELVTGQRPFEADDLMGLLMRVANEPPPAPHVVDRSIPRGLSDVILRCLGKRPEQRFASYTALASALTPYGSVAPTPATVGRRLLAGMIDNAVILAISVLVFLTIAQPLLSGVRLPAFLASVILVLPAVLYYGLTESRWSRSPGKAICRLTVVDTGGRPVRPDRAWARAALLVAAWAVISAVHTRATMPYLRELPRRAPAWRQAQSWSVVPLFLAVVFIAARRRNGYAALHDLATGTRVVSERERIAASGRVIETAVAPAGGAVDRHGAFVVHDAAIRGREGWRAGFDERLRRRLWVRELPLDSPSVSSPRAAVSRATRLRWLAGQRDGTQARDFYEYVPGRPVTEACATPRRWVEARRWLLDLAQELDAQDAGDRPPLRIDRVWVLDSGRVKLLDDPTIDAVAGTDAEALTRTELLAEVARLARRSSTEPWPLHAERFVDALASADPAEADEVLRTMRASGTTDRVSRSWRGLSLVGQLAIPLVAIGGPLLLQVATAIRQPPLDPTFAVVLMIDALDRADRRQVAIPAADREAMERVLASQFRQARSAWRVLGGLPDRTRLSRVRAIAARYPTDAGFADAAARPAVRAVIGLPPAKPLPSLLYAAMLLYDALVKVALCALALALVARGALLRLLGFEIVTADGPASRRRVLARTAIAWAAILGPALVFAWSGDWYVNIATNIAVVYAMLVVQLTGAAVAIARPMEGLQDRLAGTWIVPR